jgi:hypothetical protein
MKQAAQISAAPSLDSGESQRPACANYADVPRLRRKISQGSRKRRGIIRKSAVRREKAVVHRGWKSLPGAGSFRPVTIEAVVEVTKPLKPSVQRVAMAAR